MKKRLLALLAAALLICTSTPVTVFAEKEQAQDKDDASSPRSEVELLTTATQNDLIEEASDVDADIKDEIATLIPETMEDIYINNVDDFLEFVENCRLDTWSVNKRVILNEDISLLRTDFDYVPTFGGIFDGQDHTISEYNLTDGLSHVGLFAEIQKTGIVCNLNVSGSIIPSGEQIRIGGLCGENFGYIKNCSFKGVISSNDYVGGITSYNHVTGIIEDCSASGYIKGIHFVGAVAGMNEGDINRCRNEAMVNTTNVDTQITIDSMTGLNKMINLIKNVGSTKEEANADTTATDVGGIAGHSLGIISRCLNMGDVGYEHVGYNIGGIVGRQSGYVVNCTNNGKILGRKDVGGIVGQAEPYITVDLGSDIAYQLTEAINQLHDTVTATLKDTKNQSDVISNRLSTIQQYTAAAIEDVRYLADGTVDFANGVSGATSEAFSRVDYILEESSKNDGVLDQVSYATNDFKKSSDNFKNTLKDIDVDKYLSDEKKQSYHQAQEALEGATQTYSELCVRSYRAYYNLYILDHMSDAAFTSTGDLEYWGSNGKLTYSHPTETQLTTDLGNDLDTYGLRQEGTWKHVTDDKSFPVTNKDDLPRYEEDKKLSEDAASYALSRSDTFATNNYNSGSGNGYAADVAEYSLIIANAVYDALPEMSDAARADALKTMDNLESAADHLSTAGKQTKSIVRNIADRDNISFPQLSSEYKAHTASLATNMAGMNDNFGSLNHEINNATGIIVDDLQLINDQFNNIMMLYADAVDGVLEMDYTAAFSDVSLEAASTCTDATVEGCQNFGKVEADIDTAGIAGTMAIEYDYDKESDLTGIKDSKLNSSYITKCVLRNNKNYGDAVSEKNYAAGVCGLQEMGTILGCSNYSNIESSSGDYVGGVTGASYSYIVSSFSKGILKGANYVGGISGNGNNIRNCLALVDIDGAESRYGAVAGNIGENGEVRNNFFVSDTLAGIDKVSYSRKAEPVSYKKAISGNLFEAEKAESAEDADKKKKESEGEKQRAVQLDNVTYSDVPSDFKKLMVTFVVEDEDLAGGSEVVARINKDYGDDISSCDYPGLKNKEGFYASWDVPELKNITTDKVVTATYKRYRTTLAEDDVSDELYQSEILVDGLFKEDDVLKVERTINFDIDDLESLSEYEVMDVTIPDDGRKVHQIRFKPINIVSIAMDFLGSYLRGDYTLYQVKDGERIRLTPTGSMGQYATYEIEGNNFTLSLDYAEAKGAANRILVIAIVIIVALIVALIVVIVLIRKNGKHAPKLVKKLIRKMSAKIESKEQIFYDDSREETKTDAAAEVETDTETDSEVEKESDSEIQTDPESKNDD